MQELRLLEQLYLFRNVPRPELEALVLMCEPVKLAAHQVLLRQGDPADRAHLVISGRLVATLETEHGPELVGDVRAGEIVGETALFLDGEYRSATVAAAEPTLCLAIGPEVFERAPSSRAVVAVEKHMLGTLARRIRGSNQLVQRAWKHAADAAPAQEPPPLTLGERLRSFFGGSR